MPSIANRGAAFRPARSTTSAVTGAITAASIATTGTTTGSLGRVSAKMPRTPAPRIAIGAITSTSPVRRGAAAWRQASAPSRSAAAAAAARRPKRIELRHLAGRRPTRLGVGDPDRRARRTAAVQIGSSPARCTAPSAPSSGITVRRARSSDLGRIDLLEPRRHAIAIEAPRGTGPSTCHSPGRSWLRVGVSVCVPAPAGLPVTAAVLRATERSAWLPSCLRITSSSAPRVRVARRWGSRSRAPPRHRARSP